jgi:hypothetical protein
MTRKSPNYLPESIGDGFLTELVGLVDQLASDGTPKELYLRSELLTKYCDNSTTPADMRSKAAIQKWLSSENRNRNTNHRLYLEKDASLGWVDLDDLLAFARRIIKDTLGSIDDARVFPSYHTNGASTGVRRSPLASILKHSGVAQGTAPALLQWWLATRETVLADQPCQEVRGSVLFTVPKKSEIDRAACKEPEINLFLQKGVGDHIRRRLSRHGIDLNDQTVNQELAREALDLGLATIDLSSASDSISKQLVFDLLPFDWWSYLWDIRSPETFVDGEWIELEMFSSMGNGFTFELESLLFWALTRSVCYFSGVKGRVSVYGDDIIAPSLIVPRLVRFFHFIGFTINEEKSYWRGPFRESCGKHYHNSRDITPFYVRGPVRSKTDLIRLLNRLMEWDGRHFWFLTDPRVFEFHRRWSKHIPEYLWGGQDPDDITSLVSGHSPRSRLIFRSRDLLRKRPDLQSAALLYWLTRKEGQPNLDLVVDASDQDDILVVKQPDSLVHTAWDPWFLGAMNNPISACAMHS